MDGRGTDEQIDIKEKKTQLNGTQTTCACPKPGKSRG